MISGRHPAILWAIRGHETRRWAFYNIGARMCGIDTGMQYGPQQWLRAAPAPVMPRHIEDRLFMPVDVMRGQTTLDGCDAAS